MKTLLFNALVLLLSLVVLPPSVVADDGAGIIGTWLAEEKTGKIEIFRCGKKYCGKIVWIKPSTKEPDPSALVDVHNPDPAKRSRKLIGMTMLWGLTYDKGDKKWENGSIYDNRRGKVFSCELSLEPGGDALLLRGFVGISLLGKTTVWTRVK